MPPRLHLLGASRSLSIRARPLVARHKPTPLSSIPYRGYANETDPQPANGLNQDILGNVNEEAAGISKVMGETQPDLSQVTRAQKVLGRDGESMEMAPGVVRNEMRDPKHAAEDEMTLESLLATGEMDTLQDAASARDVNAPGHLFGVPNLPLPSDLNLKQRYDPAVQQFTNLIMKHGKLAVAQNHMSQILNHLRTSPPPTPSPVHPLLPGAPPPEQLPLNPVLYLTLAIDSVAPLMRIRSQKGAAGGGAALQIPVPLGLRQRRRAAISWILDAVKNKQSKGSGRGQFPQRVANELISVVEGRSGAWDRRQVIHKTGTGARINLNYSQRRR